MNIIDGKFIPCLGGKVLPRQKVHPVQGYRSSEAQVKATHRETAGATQNSASRDSEQGDFPEEARCGGDDGRQRLAGDRIFHQIPNYIR